VIELPLKINKCLKPKTFTTNPNRRLGLGALSVRIGLRAILPNPHARLPVSVRVRFLHAVLALLVICVGGCPGLGAPAACSHAGVPGWPLIGPAAAAAVGHPPRGIAARGFWARVVLRGFLPNLCACPLDGRVNCGVVLMQVGCLGQARVQICCAIWGGAMPPLSMRLSAGRAHRQGPCGGKPRQTGGRSSGQSLRLGSWRAASMRLSAGRARKLGVPATP